MTIQSDKWIKKMAKDHSMIMPFEDKQVSKDKISFEEVFEKTKKCLIN